MNLKTEPKRERGPHRQPGKADVRTSGFPAGHRRWQEARSPCQPRKADVRTSGFLAGHRRWQEARSPCPPRKAYVRCSVDKPLHLKRIIAHGQEKKLLPLCRQKRAQARRLLDLAGMLRPGSWLL